MWNDISGPINLPTRWGEVRIFGFTDTLRGITQLALVMGMDFEKEVLVRVQSSCIFSEVFLGLDCDCRPQLEKSLQLMQESGGGIFIYLAQEGRGAGLHNKIMAIKLQQELTIDTVEAYHKLGLASGLLAKFCTELIQECC
jgi:3,4-dihydroxy 2-butanone 4-phosphate synthase / GTP cyclohydrolase II